MRPGTELALASSGDRYRSLGCSTGYAESFRIVRVRQSAPFIHLTARVVGNAVVRLRFLPSQSASCIGAPNVLRLRARRLIRETRYRQQPIAKPSASRISCAITSELRCFDRLCLDGSAQWRLPSNVPCFNGGATALPPSSAISNRYHKSVRS